MKKSLLVLATLVPLAVIIAGMQFSSQSREDEPDDDGMGCTFGIAPDARSKWLASIRPVVRVTRRTVAKDLFEEFSEGKTPEIAGSRFEVFNQVKVREAADLRDSCIDAVVHGAKDSKQEWRGLDKFFRIAYPAWERGLPMRCRFVALPCFAEFVVQGGKPGWLVVANWESDEDPDGALTHIAMFLVDPDSGEVRDFQRCE